MKRVARLVTAIDETNRTNEKVDAMAQYFREADPKVVFVRQSNNARLVLFEGVHDMVYNPGLLWMQEQQRRPAAMR